MTKARNVLWLLVAMSSVLGAFVAVVDSSNSETVFQAIHALTSGIAFAVIPYCVVRALDEAAKKVDVEPSSYAVGAIRKKVVK